MTSRRPINAILLILALAVLFFLVPPLISQNERGDFRSYWSASYLLGHRENMYDGERMLEIQRTYAGVPAGTWPLVTLSPPWSVLMFVPLTLLPFERAAWIMLLINVLLLGMSGILLWQNVVRDGPARKRLWIPLLAAFAFSINLTAIMNGQTTIFALAMVAAFLALEKQRRDVWAGVAIAATLVKPQTVFVTIVIVMLEILRTRRWRMAWGFVGTAVATALILWALRPPWLQEYLTNTREMNALGWESSNLTGILFVLTNWTGVRFLAVLVIPLVALGLWRMGTRLNFRLIVDASLLLSLITAPYGFSYDQTVLLAPLLTILALIASGAIPTVESVVILGALIAADAVSYYERILSPSELYYFWVPLVVAVLYVYSLLRTRASPVLPKSPAISIVEKLTA